MQSLDFTILYVADVSRSVEFYTTFLDRSPIEQSPTFAMFGFANGVMFGLWQKDGVVPSVAAKAGGSELAFVVGDKDEVNAHHRRWVRLGHVIGQPPQELDFGYSAVLLDPDGHRIRVMKPGG